MELEELSLLFSLAPPAIALKQIKPPIPIYITHPETMRKSPVTPRRGNGGKPPSSQRLLHSRLGIAKGSAPATDQLRSAVACQIDESRRFVSYIVDRGMPFPVTALATAIFIPMSHPSRHGNSKNVH